MSQPKAITKATPLTDLELYELIVAAYPERFKEDDENGDDLWDSVMDFVSELCEDMNPDELCRLLGRLVMLTMPMRAAFSGTHRHALGAISFNDGEAFMTAAVTREIITKP
jgi:hypothetical protein